MFTDGSKFCEQFLKTVTQGTFLWNYFKILPVVSEEIVKNFFMSVECKKSPLPWRQCFSTDQNFMNSFWKRSPKKHSCEIISKLDQGFQRSRFFKNFFMSVECKKSPPNGGHVFGGSKFREQFFKKSHPRNNPVKLFQNLASGFWGEDFRRICLKSPPPPPPPRQPCFLTDQNFKNNLQKGSHKEQSCEIISKLDQRFQRRRFLKNSLTVSQTTNFRPFQTQSVCRQF